MTGLEYRLPPLTDEERERGRRRFLRSHRPMLPVITKTRKPFVGTSHPK